jgi:hypothetical protein
MMHETWIGIENCQTMTFCGVNVGYGLHKNDDKKNSTVIKLMVIKQNSVVTSLVIKCFWSPHDW